MTGKQEETLRVAEASKRALFELKIKKEIKKNKAADWSRGLNFHMG